SLNEILFSVSATRAKANPISEMITMSRIAITSADPRSFSRRVLAPAVTARFLPQLAFQIMLFLLVTPSPRDAGTIATKPPLCRPEPARSDDGDHVKWIYRAWVGLELPPPVPIVNAKHRSNVCKPTGQRRAVDACSIEGDKRDGRESAEAHTRGLSAFHAGAE